MHKEFNSPPEASVIQSRIAAFDTSEFACQLGIRIIEANDGYSRVVMPATGKKNPQGVIHGGAIFTLADHAFAIAANVYGTDRVAVSVSIRFLSPASGDLEAVAERIGESGKFSTYRIMVHEGRRLIAAFDGIAMQVSP